MSDWHLMDIKCRRLVLQFLAYSNRPWKLKSGFITMNINTFLSVSRDRLSLWLGEGMSYLYLYSFFFLRLYEPRTATSPFSIKWLNRDDRRNYHSSAYQRSRGFSKKSHSLFVTAFISLYHHIMLVFLWVRVVELNHHQQVSHHRRHHLQE